MATGFAIRDSAGDYRLNRGWLPSAPQEWLERLKAAAHEEMVRLNTDLAETVSLASLFEDHIRVVHVIESPQQIRMSNYPDRILAPYASSRGKAVAAFQSPEKLQRLLSVYGIYATTPHSITDPALIREELARVRERGWSKEREETVRGGCRFGVPMHIGGEPVRAAMSVSLPTFRLTERLEQRVPQLLLEAAARIAEKMVGSRR